MAIGTTVLQRLQVQIAAQILPSFSEGLSGAQKEVNQFGRFMPTKLKKELGVLNGRFKELAERSAGLKKELAVLKQRGARNAGVVKYWSKATTALNKDIQKQKYIVEAASGAQRVLTRTGGSVARAQALLTAKMKLCNLQTGKGVAQYKKLHSYSRELTRATEREGDAQKNLSVRKAKATARQKEYTISLGRANRQLAGAEKRLDAVTKATAKLGEKTKDQKKAEAELEEKTRKLTATFRGQARGMMVLGASAVAAYAVLVATMMKFEKTMMEVTTILETKELPAMDRLRASILQTSVAYGVMAGDAGQALYEILSAQMGAAAAGQVLEKSAILAKAGFIDLRTAADATTTLINSFGMSAYDAERATDLLFLTVRKGKIRMNELASQLGRIAATASQAGISAEELAATIAILTNTGLRSGIAMTSLGSLLRDFIKPSTDAQITAWRDFGVVLNADTVETEGLITSMAKFKDATTKQMGVLFPQIRGLRAVMALKESLAKASETLTYMQTEEGATAEALSRIQESLFYQLDRSKAGVQALVIALGEWMDITRDAARATKGLADTLESMVKGLTNAKAAGDTVFSKLAGTVTAATALTGVIYMLIGAVALFKTIIVKVGMSLGATVGSLTIWSAIIASSIIAIKNLYGCYQALAHPLRAFIEQKKKEIAANEKAVESVSQSFDAYRALGEELDKLQEKLEEASKRHISKIFLKSL